MVLVGWAYLHPCITRPCKAKMKTTTLARAMSTKNLGSPDDEAGMLRDILRQMHEMREAQEKLAVQAESTSIIVDQADVTVTALPGEK